MVEMNSFLSRLNTIFAFTLSVMAGLTFCCFLTTNFNTNEGNVSLGTGRLSVKEVRDYTAEKDKKDLGFVVFDLQAESWIKNFNLIEKVSIENSTVLTDLTPIFNWNVKQLFLYLTAEYKTSSHPLNQVVLWDKIIERGNNAILDLKNANTKYYFWDFGHGLRGNPNVTLTLSWNVIPNAGRLPKIMGTGSHSFAFPNDYSSGRF